METDVPQPTARPKMQGPLAVKSKVTKPAEHQQERASEQNMIDAIQSRLNMPPRPEAGLISIAASRPIATVAVNPQMPEATPDAPKMHAPNKEEAPTTEIFLEEAVDADITHLAEQRAMHTVFRYQTLAVQHAARASPGSAVAPTTLPPVAPAVSLYANLPQEWPLARLSVQLRHIGVLLRVTLFRRVAELNFRGIEFRSLPREVMTSIIHDFNNIGGELARRLASLFAFLRPAAGAETQEDKLGLALYADPAYWLYGLLSFCAKACEAKIDEANGTPLQRTAKEESGMQDTEATGKTLALMQTVVMSFGRNQSLGKPDLPIHHLHVYFPVQLVHRLIERMTTDLRFTAAASEEGKEYKHNSESETNSPYIVVGTYESECRPNNPEGADLPDTPSLACAYVQGLLDGNLGQIVSFQSTYKSTLRIEVPVWPDVHQAVLSPVQAQPQPSFSGTISPVTTQGDQHRGVPLPQANTPAEHYSAQREEEEEADEVEEDKYVVPDGQGCFSFTQSLLLRAKDTYAARCTGNRYEIISQ